MPPHVFIGPKPDRDSTTVRMLTWDRTGPPGLPDAHLMGRSRHRYWCARCGRRRWSPSSAGVLATRVACCEANSCAAVPASARLDRQTGSSRRGSLACWRSPAGRPAGAAPLPTAGRHRPSPMDISQHRAAGAFTSSSVGGRPCSPPFSFAAPDQHHARFSHNRPFGLIPGSAASAVRPRDRRPFLARSFLCGEVAAKCTPISRQVGRRAPRDRP